MRFVEDSAMPANHDWAFCVHEESGVTTLAIRESTQRLPASEKERLLEEAWAAAREHGASPRDAFV